MPLTWTRTQDGEHNGKPCYEYHATCEDRRYHIVWAYDHGGQFGYTAARFNAHDGCTEYLAKPECRIPHGITWAKTLKRCKQACEVIDAAHLSRERTILVPNIAGSFKSFADWVNTAPRVLANRTCDSSTCTMPVAAICVDTEGRRCYQGGDFMRARDEDAFPVVYFWDCKLEKINVK
jgi:hypothetical protein